MNYLIIKTSSLGDIIQALPVIDYLRQKTPDAKIDWVVEKRFSELVQCHPYVNRTILIDSKRWRRALWKKGMRREIQACVKDLQQQYYDVLFDLQGNIKSAVFTWLARARWKVGFGVHTVPEFPNLFVTHRRFNPPKGQNIREDYLYLAQRFFYDTGKLNNIGAKTIFKAPTKDFSNYIRPEGFYILVCPGANWPNKCLPDHTLTEFLKLLQIEYACHFLFTWGTKEEHSRARQLAACFPQNGQVIERLPLIQLQKLMQEVELVIAMDSLPLHLCGTTATPSFALFGPSSAHKYNPSGVHHYAAQGPCPYGYAFEKRCSSLRTCPAGECIHSFTVKELFLSFQTWWKNEPNGCEFTKH